MSRVRAAWHRRHDSDGFSLIELLVSMIVFTVAIAMVYGALIKVQARMDDTGKSAEAISELRAALADIDKQVRSGNVLFSPADDSATTVGCLGSATLYSGTCMRIYTQTNGPQKCVQWQVIADPADVAHWMLRTRSWADSVSPVATDWRTVARGLKPVTGLGQYPFWLQREAVGATSAPTVAAAATAVDPYDQRLLGVNIVAEDERDGKDVAIGSSLSGRNTTYGYAEGVCTPVPASTLP
ncbi:MAG: prepilin-type cleavage/methylation-like protein [Frankiales bacterium]|nr:prepilin-type cleavage/methylation-like protein [Frankiales bacterium]